MLDLKDQIQTARLKAIQELEKKGKDAYLPANVWGFELSVIDRAGFADSTKYAYRHELIDLINSGISPSDFEALQKYVADLKLHRRNMLRRALRLMILGKELSAKGSPTPENLPVIQALVSQLETERENVKVNAAKDTNSYIWLSPSQVKYITGICGKDLEGKRDFIVLGLLLGAGLHRAELITITFDSLKKQPGKNGKMRDVLQVSGRNGKGRIVPISPLLAGRLREWEKIVGGGYIARSCQSKKLGKSMSVTSLHQIVRKYGVMIGVPELKTDDLRRTYAQLAYNSGITPIHIKELMGHESLRTTERYLNLTVDLEDITGEFVPLME